MSFKVRATCSSVPTFLFYETIDGNDRLTVQGILNVINDRCPLFKSGDYHVLLNGVFCNKTMLSTPISNLFNDIPPVIYVHRLDFNVLNTEEMKKLREMRDFLNRLIGDDNL